MSKFFDWIHNINNFGLSVVHDLNNFHCDAIFVFFEASFTFIHVHSCFYIFKQHKKLRRNYIISVNFQEWLFRIMCCAFFFCLFFISCCFASFMMMRWMSVMLRTNKCREKEEEYNNLNPMLHHHRCISMGISASCRSFSFWSFESAMHKQITINNRNLRDWEKGEE